MTNLYKTPEYKAVEETVKKASRFFTDKELYKAKTQKEGDANFVTEVDYAVQEYLVKELGRIIPGSNIITEESADNQYNFAKPTWILDPVDGTTNLMHQYRHSCISLALILGGSPVVGMVFNPYLKELFSGISGQGAYLNDIPFETSRVSSLAGGLIGFGTTPYDRSKAKATFEAVGTVYARAQEIRRSGSAALDIAYVACGRLDGFFEMMLQPWDFAAGAIILEEAGGRITDWQGKPLDLLKPSGVIASNALIYDELSEIIRDVNAE
jgi:myo-inositol-1(or 4)-monophosphatase